MSTTHGWCTLSCEYFREFRKKFTTAVMVYSGARGKLIHKKARSRKSRDTVPITFVSFLLDLVSRHFTCLYLFPPLCLFICPSNSLCLVSQFYQLLILISLSVSSYVIRLSLYQLIHSPPHYNVTFIIWLTFFLVCLSVHLTLGSSVLFSLHLFETVRFSFFFVLLSVHLSFNMFIQSGLQLSFSLCLSAFPYFSEPLSGCCLPCYLKYKLSML